MKRVWMTLTILCLMMSLSLTAFAADSVYVRDDADLLTDEEEAALAAVMEAAAAELDCGIYLATVESYLFHEASPQAAAEALYIEQSMQGNVPRDGILLMLSMIERDYSLITYGEYAAKVFDDETMWDMEEDFLSYFAMNNWYGGFGCYVSEAVDELQDYYEDAVSRYGEGYVSYYQPGVPDVVARFHRVDSELWLIVAGGSMAVALVVCLIMKAGMNTAREQSHASEYIPAGGVEMRVKKDVFTHTTTHVIHHPKSEGSSGGGSGGGGGFRGHSGKF